MAEPAEFGTMRIGINGKTVPEHNSFFMRNIRRPGLDRLGVTVIKRVYVYDERGFNGVSSLLHVKAGSIAKSLILPLTLDPRVDNRNIRDTFEQDLSGEVDPLYAEGVDFMDTPENIERQIYVITHIGNILMKHLGRATTLNIGVVTTTAFNTTRPYSFPNGEPGMSYAYSLEYFKSLFPHRYSFLSDKQK